MERKDYENMNRHKIKRKWHRKLDQRDAVITLLKGYDPDRPPTCINDVTFQAAFNRAIEETLLMENGKQRVDAIYRYYIKKTDYWEGIAEKNHYSLRVVKEWGSDFICRLGIYAGYR